MIIFFLIHKYLKAYVSILQASCFAHIGLESILLGSI